jgi:hypothetical protein
VRLGIGGKVSPVRAGVSTRGMAIGLGPFRATAGLGCFGLLIQLVVIAAAMVIAIALGLLAGAVYGLYLIYKGAVALRGAHRGKAIASIVCGALLSTLCSTALVWGFRNSQQDDPTTNPTASAQSVGDLPNHVGETLDVARGDLYSWSQMPGGVDLNTSSRDLSPRNRQSMVDSNWTVAKTEPRAGERVRSGERATFFTLRNEEYLWFKKHPRMPKVHGGQTPDVLTSEGGSMSAVSELVELRYARGKAPSDATVPLPDPSSPPYGPADLSIPPPSEAAAYADLAEAEPFGVQVLGSMPATGKPVRPGRLLVLLVKDTP